MSTKQEVGNLILDMLGKKYKKGSEPYKDVQKFMNKKLSGKEISSLYIMVLSSREVEAVVPDLAGIL